MDLFEGVLTMLTRDYCKCEDCPDVFIESDDEWFVWNVCSKCGKEVECSREPLSNYDD